MDRHQILARLGQGVAERCATDFREDDIAELLALERQYHYFTTAHKAAWVTLRMATMLRCFLQRAANQQDAESFTDELLSTYMKADILPVTDILTMRGHEDKLAKIRHRYMNRPTSFDLLLGYLGLFVIPQPYKANEIVGVLRDISTPVVFDQYSKRGLPQGMEIWYPEFMAFQYQFLNYINAMLFTMEQFGVIEPRPQT